MMASPLHPGVTTDPAPCLHSNDAADDEAVAVLGLGAYIYPPNLISDIRFSQPSYINMSRCECFPSSMAELALGSQRDRLASSYESHRRKAVSIAVQLRPGMRLANATMQHVLTNEGDLLFVPFQANGFLKCALNLP
jgi:hypothetical protein